MVFPVAFFYEIWEYYTLCRKEAHMTVNISLEPLLALIAGIAILVRPKLLSYIVAIYLIVVGVLGLFNI